MRAHLLSLAVFAAVFGCHKPPPPTQTPPQPVAGSAATDPAGTPAASQPAAPGGEGSVGLGSSTKPPPAEQWPCEAPDIEDINECLMMQLGVGERLNDLSLGMSAKEVLALLKKPAKKGKTIEEGATGLFLQDWEYPALGLRVQMGADTAKGPQRVNRINVTAPSDRKTSRGVGIGTPVEEALRLYAKTYDRTLDNSEGFVAGSVFGGGVLFRVTDGKVSEIYIGQMAE